MLDRARPSGTRTWPRNGLFFHLALHKDQSWRAVVCASEKEAEAIFGADVG